MTEASIIFNGSVLAVMGMPGWSAYGATKAGVRAMTRILASELAPRRIRVNQVTPGGTKTPIWSPFAPSEDAQTALENRIVRGVPLGRMGETTDIANAVLFLASDESSYVTGEELVVDGGQPEHPMVHRSIKLVRRAAFSSGTRKQNGSPGTSRSAVQTL